MLRVLSWVMWIVMLGSVGCLIYYWQEMQTEMASSGTEDVAYVQAMGTQWHDSRPRPAIQAPENRKEQIKKGKEAAPGSCGKVAEMTIPSLSGQIYNIVFSPSASTDDLCLKKSPILFNRPQTVFPGDPGLAVISGHRDTHFRYPASIEKMYNRKSIGSYLFINDQKKLYTYQLRKFWKVKKEQAEAQTLKTKNSVLWITSCYPFVMTGDAPYRAIFQYELVYVENSSGFHSGKKMDGDVKRQYRKK